MSKVSTFGRESVSRYVQQNVDQLKSDHQHRVESFVIRMKGLEPVTDTPRDHLSDESRLFLARLVIEEVFEYVRKGLGVRLLCVSPAPGQDVEGFAGVPELDFTLFDFDVTKKYDIIEAIDGAADVRFVVTQLFTFLGLPDEPFQQYVDLNNLEKFGPGHFYDENGKLNKPESHRAPRIEALLDGFLNRS